MVGVVWIYAPLSLTEDGRFTVLAVREINNWDSSALFPSEVQHKTCSAFLVLFSPSCNAVKNQWPRGLAFLGPFMPPCLLLYLLSMARVRRETQRFVVVEDQVGQSMTNCGQGER